MNVRLLFFRKSGNNDTCLSYFRPYRPHSSGKTIEKSARRRSFFHPYRQQDRHHPFSFTPQRPTGTSAQPTDKRNVGQHPLWSNARIIEFFSRLGDKEILQGIRMTHQGAAAVNYRRYRWLNGHPWKAGSFPNKLRVALQRLTYGIGIRKPLSFRLQGIEYQLYKGASWWAISPELAAYVLYEWDTNKTLVKYFSTAFCPDETFIQTIAFNSPFASRCMLQEGRYTSLSALTPLTYIDYHPVIKVLTEEDWPALKQSGKMFCRKTVTGISDRLLDRIDRERNV